MTRPYGRTTINIDKIIDANDAQAMAKIKSRRHSINHRGFTA